jgi:hypothetical protein
LPSFSAPAFINDDIRGGLKLEMCDTFFFGGNDQRDFNRASCSAVNFSLALYRFSAPQLLIFTVAVSGE